MYSFVVQRLYSEISIQFKAIFRSPFDVHFAELALDRIWSRYTQSDRTSLSGPSPVMCRLPRKFMTNRMPASRLKVRERDRG